MAIDTLIVGGGSAGCVLANRLSEDPSRQVVLVEAGADHPDFASAPDLVRLAHGAINVLDQLAALDWAYTAHGSATSPLIEIPRGRVMGGSGSINGTIFLRGTVQQNTCGAAWTPSAWIQIPR